VAGHSPAVALALPSMQEQTAVLRRLYARSSLRQLREEGVVLTHLAAAEEDRLYSDFVWRLYLHPQYAPPAAAGAPKNGHSAVQGAVSAELPYHKFQRGDSCLITWTLQWGGRAAAQVQDGAASAAAEEESQRQHRPQQLSMSGSESGSEGGSASEGEGRAQREGDSLEATVLEVKRTHLLLTLSKEASSHLEELMEGEPASQPASQPASWGGQGGGEWVGPKRRGFRVSRRVLAGGQVGAVVWVEDAGTS
jgi:hypothetical protein